MLTADDIPSLDAHLAPLDARLAPPMDTRQRGFWIALGCALLFHSALLIELNRAGVARHAAGTAEGADNAIAVELVTEADLKSRETIALPPPGGAPPVKPSVEPQPTPPPPPEQAETPPEKPAEPAQPPPEPPPPEPKPPEKQAAATPPPEPAPPQPQPEAKSPTPAFEPLVPDLADLPPPDLKKESKPEEKKPEPAEKQTKAEEAQKQAKPPQQPAKKKQAKLDLNPAPAMPSVSAVGPGRAAGASRPPGITRSGENDDFGRGVIRALRATMPAPNGTFGRVTVRLLLNDNGDLAQVQVLEPSGKPGLDQSVVFSTKQAYFPLPPRGSTAVDRTFLITYVYR